jgi:hypothetical protein
VQVLVLLLGSVAAGNGQFPVTGSWAMHPRAYRSLLWVAGRPRHRSGAKYGSVPPFWKVTVVVRASRSRLMPKSARCQWPRVQQHVARLEITVHDSGYSKPSLR